MHGHAICCIVIPGAAVLKEDVMNQKGFTLIELIVVGSTTFSEEVLTVSSGIESNAD